MVMMFSYPSLRSRSDYTLGRGASMTKDLVKAAANLGMPALALTDETALHGAFPFCAEAKAAGVQPIIGLELEISVNGVEGWVVLLAQSDKGYINLSHLVEEVYRPVAGQKGKQVMQVVDTSRPVPFETLQKYAEGVILLSGEPSRGLLPQALAGAPEQMDPAYGVTRALLEVFGDRFYIELCRNDAADAQANVESFLLDCAYGGAGEVVCADGVTRCSVPLVATTNAWYATENRHMAWLMMKAQTKKELIILKDGALEEDDGRRFHLRGETDMAALFEDVPEALRNTLSVAQRCSYATSDRKPILPPFKTETGCSEVEELRRMSHEGLARRFAALNIAQDLRPGYIERLDFELSVIEGMGFPGYFLIVADFIQWAKRQGIPVGPGRGSGAGSLVAYALTITNVDPLRWGLLFERFLNPDRVSMPDFDIDFCIERRDEVINYVREKYGDSNVSMISTFGRIMSRAAIRDVQRILVDRNVGSFNYGDSADILALMPNSPADLKKTLSDHEEENALLREHLKSNPKARILFDAAKTIEGLRRNLSTHAAGVIIADRPLVELFPVVRDVNTLVPISAYSMKYSEMAGAVKFDFLGLKNLTTIDKAVKNIKAFMGEDLDIDLIPLDDPKVFPFFAEGRTTGVFQFSGPGMRNALRQVKPTSIGDLTAVNALYRPGPMQYIPEFAARKQGIGMSDDVYPMPVEKTKPFLSETHGLMVYQEQVMMVARVCAGYSLGAADLLRRAMGKKQAEEMVRQKNIFINGDEKSGVPGAVALGMPETKASELFDDILKFADYGFNKSHALAYSLLAYINLYLKVYYPACYYAALLTYSTKPEERALVKEEMDEIGLALLPPDINRSDLAFIPERDEEGKLAVRFGLSAIAKVSESAEAFVNERRMNGLYGNLTSFHERCRNLMNIGVIESLAYTGAFDAMNPNRASALASLRWLFSGKSKKKAPGQTDFFTAVEDLAPVIIPDYDPKTQEAIAATPEWSDRAAREFSAVRFYFNEHPIHARKARLPKLGVKRRMSYQLYMKKTRSAELSNRRVCVMVDSVQMLTTTTGTPYITAKVSEQQDHYTVRFFTPRTKRFNMDDQFKDMPLEEVKRILSTAQREMIPVVILGRLTWDETFGVGVTGRAAMMADAYLAGVRTDHTIVVAGTPGDPATLSGAQGVIAGLKAMFKRVGTDNPMDSVVRVEDASGALIEQLPGFYAIEDMHIKAMRAMAGIAYSYQPLLKTDRSAIDLELEHAAPGTDGAATDDTEDDDT